MLENYDINYLFCFAFETCQDFFFECHCAKEVWKNILVWLNIDKVRCDNAIDYFLNFISLFKGNYSKNSIFLFWLPIIWCIWNLRNINILRWESRHSRNNFGHKINLVDVFFLCKINPSHHYYKKKYFTIVEKGMSSRVMNRGNVKCESMCPLYHHRLIIMVKI